MAKRTKLPPLPTFKESVRPENSGSVKIKNKTRYGFWAFREQDWRIITRGKSRGMVWVYIPCIRRRFKVDVKQIQYVPRTTELGVYVRIAP